MKSYLSLIQGFVSKLFFSSSQASLRGQKKYSVTGLLFVCSTMRQVSCCSDREPGSVPVRQTLVYANAVEKKDMATPLERLPKPYSAMRLHLSRL